MSPADEFGREVAGIGELPAVRCAFHPDQAIGDCGRRGASESVGSEPPAQDAH